MIWRLLSILVLVSVVAGASLYVPSIIYEAPLPAQVIATKADSEEVEKIEVKEEESKTEQNGSVELFFSGDIMLGRDVENRIAEEGIAYPFEYVKDLLIWPDLTVGNFEGIVPETHTQTPSMTFQFSIRNEYLTYLKRAGFDVLSLANNHSFDYGAEALSHTRSICHQLRIVCGGSPTGFDSHSVHTQNVAGEEITFIFMHSLWSIPSEESLDTLFARVDMEDGMKIAYVHWGDEYVLTHNNTQQVIAEKLIDRGVDVVVGHHPHVVQDVGFYKGRPIFYSLGNFIFDQYFSEDVQEGLGVRVEIEAEEYIFTLIPLTSKESKNQPRVMKNKEKERLLERILDPIRGYPGVDSDEGVIRVLR